MSLRIYTIPPERPFAETIAGGLLQRYGGEPLALTEAALLLPTRRACRAMEEAFLRQADGAALLLPAITPIGDIDEEEVGFLSGAFDIPPAITPMRRQLLLTRLILEKGEAEGARPSASQAARLAAELARLLDQVQTERLSFDALATLVPEDYARHWQVTLEFLSLVTRAWPAVLAEEGLVDPAERRNRLIEAQLAAWRAAPPGPVIAAGSTGSIPATADLLAAVAAQPEGEVVLPGLDTTLDAAEAAALPPTHPQFGMARLLARLRLAPRDVEPWPGMIPASDPGARTELVNRALRTPGDAAGPGEAQRLAAGLRGLSRVDCPGSREEATVIALALREALETAGRRAALVTPDRGLARRVAAELRRWNIEIDDSAGLRLADTPPGVFLRLVARLAATDVEPVPLLAALKHPLAAGGRTVAAFRGQVRNLELAALRGARPAPGIGGIRRALPRDRDPALDRFLADLERILAPLNALLARRRAPVTEALTTHLSVAEALAATDDTGGAERLWSGEAGDALAQFVSDLHAAAAALTVIDGRDWPAFLETLMEGQVVRPRYGRHPRLHIWGPLEARLQHADLLVLGGLNEGAWPADPGADPWLSRPMRTRFGLPELERRIGLAAHDFVQGFASPEVLLTRATRVEGAPTVPSRWLLLIDNLLDAAGLKDGLRRDEPKWLGWQNLLDEPEDGEPPSLRAPAPCPPVEARPRQLSVTQIETLRRDPYAVYARHVLRLRSLDPIDADPGAAERGTVIHDALDGFLRAFPGAFPADALDRLLAFGRDAFAAFGDRPGVNAFWWPRFERVAKWFVMTERARRASIRATHSEVPGELVVEGPAGPFRLIAKADRIDVQRDGRIVIIDYKTGGTPKAKDIALGFAPQLSLEAAIAVRGGFPEVPPAEVAALAFWRMTGGDPPGEIKMAGDDPEGLARAAFHGLKRTVAAFDDPSTNYPSIPDGAFAPRFSDYRHLARVDEWITGT